MEVIIDRCDDERTCWPAWRSPTELPRCGVAVLVTLVNEAGYSFVDIASLHVDASELEWRLIDDSPLSGELLAWMPTPPPSRAPRLSAKDSAWLDSLGAVSKDGWPKKLSTDEGGELIMGWQKVCNVYDDSGDGGDTGELSLWRTGSGMSLGLGLQVARGDIIELPVVELRKVLLDGLMSEVLWQKLEALDGDGIMRILFERLEEQAGDNKAVYAESLEPEGLSKDET